VIDTEPLNIALEVGAFYFKGETAECSVQTTFKGTVIDATSINAKLMNPDGTFETLTLLRIATGLYDIHYTLNGKGSKQGTYTVIVEASYITDTVMSSGTTITTFVVKPTWERELPRVAALSMVSMGLIGGMVLLWRRDKKKFL
jgi:hypothetical protein